MIIFLAIAFFMIVLYVTNYFIPHILDIFLIILFFVSLFLVIDTFASIKKAGRTIMLLNIQNRDEKSVILNWIKIIAGGIWIPVILIGIFKSTISLRDLVRPLPYILISLPALVEVLSKNRITEYGFLSKYGNLTRWEQIQEWYWKDDDSSILIIKAKRKHRLLRNLNNDIIITEWEIPNEFKTLVNNILCRYIP